MLLTGSRVPDLVIGAVVSALVIQGEVSILRVKGSIAMCWPTVDTDTAVSTVGQPAVSVLINY